MQADTDEWNPRWEDRKGQITTQFTDLHEAVRVCMVMDGAALARVPAQHY